MLGSDRSRGTRYVDDPWDDDGFYTNRRFKARRRSGQSGGRPARRVIRAKERAELVHELRTGQHD